MAKWVCKGLKTGVKTTRYPGRPETAGGVSPGLPIIEPKDQGELTACPTSAVKNADCEMAADYSHCVHCFRCVRGSLPLFGWREGYEWGTRVGEDGGASGGLGKAFIRSIHIRVIDAGACGACLSEIGQLTKPHYSMHRLGFFITPTPRHADVLLVAGPVTDNIRLALEKTYTAMPTPKAVIAMGACALSGGVFGRTFASEGGVPNLVPVDVAIPGCPPPPLAILHGLLVLTGRKPSSALIHPESLKKRRITE
jgi:Ni,Fe-hydrogenase III small subunit